MKEDEFLEIPNNDDDDGEERELIEMSEITENSITELFDKIFDGLMSVEDVMLSLYHNIKNNDSAEEIKKLSEDNEKYKQEIYRLYKEIAELKAHRSKLKQKIGENKNEF